MIEVPADLFRRDVGSPLGCQAKVLGHVLEAVAFQVAGADVIVLGQDPRVHDVPTEDFVLPIGDGPLGDLHAGGVASEEAPVPPQVELDPESLGPRLDVF